MRAYLTVLDADTAIVPHWVRHYLSLGATAFPVITYGEPGDLDTVADLVRDAGGEPLKLAAFPSAEFSAKRREAYIASVHPAGEWAFFCDADEFAATDAATIQDAIRCGASYVGGRWLDRLAEGGKLVDVQPEPSIFEQYPCGARLRQHWRMGYEAFVASPVAPSSHHPYADEFGQRNRKRARWVDVWHFKWQRNVVARLERRLERIRAVGKADTSWYRRVEAMLRHLRRHDGIDPRLLRRQPLFR